jgi:hypothetical protein
MNSKTTLPLLDAAAHDEVVDVLRRLTVAYPDSVQRSALRFGACWREGRSY